MDSILPMFLNEQPALSAPVVLEEIKAEALYERAVYAGMYRAFPTPLQSALKTAAQRNDWQPEDWSLQVGLVFDALSGGMTAEALTRAYSGKPEKPRPSGRGGCQ